MDSLPFVSVDMLTSSSSHSGQITTGGGQEQEGLFAAHLAQAAHGQTSNTTKSAADTTGSKLPSSQSETTASNFPSFSSALQTEANEETLSADASIGMEATELAGAEATLALLMQLTGMDATAVITAVEKNAGNGASPLSQLLTTITEGQKTDLTTQEVLTTVQELLQAQTTESQKIVTNILQPEGITEQEAEVMPAQPLLTGTVVNVKDIPTNQTLPNTSTTTSTSTTTTTASTTTTTEASPFVVSLDNSRNSEALATNQLPASAASNQSGNGTTPTSSQQSIQNDYGQIITIHQSSRAEELAVNTVRMGQASSTEVTGQRQNIDNNYIHAHLPNETSTVSLNNNKSLSQNNTGDQQQQQAQSNQDILMQEEGSTQNFTLKTNGSLGSDSVPLTFSYMQNTATTTASTTGSQSTNNLLLASGQMVPDTTVMDQLVTHFSINQRLETSTVNLKLYPEELGELKLEIKVEQDNIKAHIIAQNPQAQEAIDRHLPRLREALEQQGLNLQEVEVTIAANDQTGDERFQDSSSQEQLHTAMQQQHTQPLFFDFEEATVEDPQEETVNNNLSVLA